MTEMPADLSILLVNWNTRELTARCLDSLPVGLSGDFRYETIVVDNGSCDGSAEVLAQRSDIRLITNAENLGYAAAVNQAYECADSEFVLLLNSDIELTPGSLTALLAFLHTHRDAAGVAPIYRNRDGSPQPLLARIPTFWMIFANASRLFQRFPGFAQRVRAYKMLDEDFSRPRPVPQPAASCLLLRRSALPENRLFDERYPIFFNDVALARLLATNGHTLWMTPDASVIHEHGASTRLLGGALKRQYIASLVRYLAQTETWPKLLLYRLLVLAQGFALLLFLRPRALGVSDLINAVRGDPGLLPQIPETEDD
jgi:GT2 family glycosyltransferase